MNQNNLKFHIWGTIVAIIIILVGGIYFMLNKSQPMQNNSKVNSAQGLQTSSSSLNLTTSSTTGVSVMKSTATSVRKNTTPVNQPSLPKTTKPVEVTPPLPVGTDQFTISINGTSSDVVAQNLFDNGFITDKQSFITLAIKTKMPFTAGAYKLSNTMTPSQILTTLQGKPYMKWLKIPEGLRKEEIANLLTKTLGWSATTKQQFITATNVNPDYTEGVYFPDTYLIPVDESPADVANRLIAKFNEKFGDLLPQFSDQNIKWTTGLTLASIVQREAANDTDTPLIAGILWNRLDQGMALGVDATLQYIRGDVGKGYWAPITVADKKTDSPYNTYINKGLPPHPISNPGLPAIKAVLNPASTTCLYYLHDSHRVTHCATTYEEHQANIQKYLVGTSTKS
ncbi:MAG: endolytic transglycosylase MltG [bacterium]